MASEQNVRLDFYTTVQEVCCDLVIRKCDFFFTRPKKKYLVCITAPSPMWKPLVIFGPGSKAPPSQLSHPVMQTKNLF